MNGKKVALKGSSLTVTRIQVLSKDVATVYSQVKERSELLPGFFSKATVVFELYDAHLPAPEDFKSLVENIISLGMNPVGVVAESDVSDVISLSGMFQLPDKVLGRSGGRREIAESAAPLPVVAPFSSAMVVEGAVRSGQQIYAKGQDLIVKGNVNNGAEVLADGHIHVYGKLRGKVFAGVSGKEDSVIYANKFSPELVCIAGVYSLADDVKCFGADGLVEVVLKNDNLEFSII